MTIQRMEHVGIVVDDLEAATAFFVELGLKLQGEGQVEGGWVWRTTKTSIGSATSAAQRGSSSSWRSESADGSGTPRLGDEAYHVARGEEVTRDPTVELVPSVE
jgi:catechol 2,3-dioxygenase-like lactoylglutathione lyase family enzyme